MDDMTDLGFFSDLNYHFTTDLDGQISCCINAAGHGYNPTIANLAAHNETPNIWTQADSFAKAFYATIMADLGQNSSANMLANSTALEYFTTNFTSTIEGQDISVMEAWYATNPAMESYSASKSRTGSLSISPSVISQQYLCQIPKLKPGGSLFVAILVADLVFLQALWKLVTWIVGWRVKRADSQASFCEGCLARHAEFELRDRTTRTTQYQAVLDDSSESRPQLRSRAGTNMSSETREQLLSP